MANQEEKYLDKTGLSLLWQKIIDKIADSIKNKSDVGHTHDYLPLSGGTVTGETTFNDNVYLENETYADSVTAGSLLVTGDARFVNGLYGNLKGNADSASSVSWDNVTGKPTSYTPSSHTHDDRYYTESEINTKVSDINSSITSHTGNKSNPHGVTKSQVGLGNVDNTSDINKPVSTAQQSAIDTAYANSNAYTDQKIANLINGAPSTLDTLGEIATAMAEHEDVVSALNEAIGTKASQSELDTHTGNSTIHITASERTNWNSAKTHADSAHARTDATKVEKSSTNGNIKINGTETTVYTHPSGTNPHGTTKSDVGLSNVPNVATNDQTPSYTEATTLAKLTSGEKLSVAFGKISKAITDLISHIGNKSNPHGVTKSQVGLGNVENKSSATIRSELTKDNVTTALGYTPPTTNTTYGVATSSALGLVKSGTDITVDSSGNVSVNNNSHTHTPDQITDGYTSNAFYINTHPENSPTIIPFINNDIAFLTKRGGSAVVKYDDVTQSVDISNVFDGSGSYWAINPTGVTTITIELTLHQVFAWTNTVYIDSGANGWRAKNMKIEVMNTNYSNDTWSTKGNVTNYGRSQYKITFSHTPSGASNAGGGFNKVKFTFSGWNNSTIFRIACLGLINYGSSGIREVCVPKDGGIMYGGITPYANNSYNIGSSDKKYANIYSANFVGNASTATSATKATQDESGNNIKASYASSIGISDHTITLKNKNGASLGTVTVPDNNTWRGIQNNLTSDSTTDSLSAAQGKVLNGKISDLQTNFQAGVDGIYDTIVAQGTTPASKSLSDVKAGINSLSTNRYNSGYNSGKTDYNPTNATLSNAGALTVTNAAGTTRLTKTFTNSYDAGVTAGTKATKVGTATAGDVLSGKTFTNSSGVGISGTMTNQGAKTSSLNCGESYTIPAGYHNGSGKITANSLASQTSATATAGDIKKGQTAWVGGTKITGIHEEATFTTQEKTVTPKSSSTIITPDTGYNGLSKVTVNGDSNLVPENIISGKSIFGVTGTATQLINKIIGRGLLYGGSANYTPSAMLDVREFNSINIHLASTNTSPTFYLHGVTEFPNASSIKSTTSSVTVPNQDSHEPITWKAISSSELETDITVDISDYDYIVMTKNYNGGTQSIAYYYEMNK